MTLKIYEQGFSFGMTYGNMFGAFSLAARQAISKAAPIFAIEKWNVKTDTHRRAKKAFDEGVYHAFLKLEGAK